MAIPLGTTSRQLSTVARWVLAGVVMVAMLAGWWPGFAAWGTLIVAVLAVLIIWLMRHVVSGEQTILTQPALWPLLGPALILSWHFVRHSLYGHGGEVGPGAGELDISMLCHLALLAVSVMLCQSLLPRAAGHAEVLSACGASMMGGAAIAIVTGGAEFESLRMTLALLGLAGVGVWLSPLWGMSRINIPLETPHPLHHPIIRAGVIVIAIAAAAGFAAASPSAATLAGGMMAVVLLISATIFSRFRLGIVLAGAALALAACVGAWRLGLSWPGLALNEAGPFGKGEAAFAQLSGRSAGITILARSVGWVGLLGFIGGLLGVLVLTLLQAGHRREGDQGRAIVWTLTVVLASAALLGVGGLFIPAVTVAVALTWGLMPRMLGRPRRERSGRILLLLTAAVLVGVGMARSAGLVTWSVARLSSQRAAPMWSHAAAGLLLGLMFAWLLGGRKAWAGLIGVLLALAAGGAGEFLQYVCSPTRQAEWGDWLIHGAGCTAALLLYGLCIAARGCESADAVEPEQAIEAYQQ